MELIELLKKLQTARIIRESSKLALAEQQARLEAAPEWKYANQLYTEAKAEEAALTEQINTLNEQTYLADGNKHPHSACEVQDRPCVTIRDMEAARKWCFKNLTGALKMDTKAFETAAKGGLVPKGLAQVTTIPKGTIAQDLSKHLGEPAVNLQAFESKMIAKAEKAK